MKRETMERKICKAAIEGLIEAGYTISVFDGEAYPLEYSIDVKEVPDTLFATEDELLEIYRNSNNMEYVGFTRFIYGNDGHDVIADYSKGLEPALKKAIDLADKLAEEEDA
jgi:hypothetical protein